MKRSFINGRKRGRKGEREKPRPEARKIIVADYRDRKLPAQGAPSFEPSNLPFHATFIVRRKEEVRVEWKREPHFRQTGKADRNRERNGLIAWI